MFGNLPQHTPITLKPKNNTLESDSKDFSQFEPCSSLWMPHSQWSLDRHTELLTVPQTADRRPLESFHQLSPLLGVTFPCFKARLSLYLFQKAETRPSA